LLWENEIWNLAPEMDGILLGSKSCSSFLYPRQELEKLIDLKCNEGNILQFLIFASSETIPLHPWTSLNK
jgi:hypothetical protein